MPPLRQSDGAANPSGEDSAQQTSNSGVQLPPQILQQADDAAAAAAAATQRPYEPSGLDLDPPIEDLPPPPYSADQYGEIDISEKGMDTGARVARDGRVDIKITSKNRQLTSLLRHQLEISQREPIPEPEPEIPEGLGYVSGLPPPPMNIVIQIVGSRGDVQPFVALGLVLKNKFNHRVRIATHPVFKDFITENDLEFFSIGGDPAELMAFMVKNPGLMPGFEAIRSGDIGKRRKGIYEMVNGCWRSCIEPGDGTGVEASDDHLAANGGVSMGDPNAKPFVADAIIANPPSFAHLHIAEKLGVPLHLMFTMPWSPTQSFPHPLANIVSSNADAAMTNFLSYILVDLLTWQGIGDVINRFRERALGLEPLSIIWAPANLHRLHIPWTYCWSPALIPKPSDWRSNIDISGFYFLNLATNYTPASDLDEFLKAGPPPVYIGFGSIVIDDPNAMTRLIFDAVKKTGQRALVSKGWGGLSGDEMNLPEGVFMLGNCPHDWLFQRVSCVVHHGGAGTTAAGIAAGRPTVVVPFFGDQQFWGQMCHRAGAGPEPIPNKELTAEKLASAINYALKPETLDRAKEMSDTIKQEKGSDTGADSFHRHLSIARMRCSICPGRVAVWQYKKSGIRLSALAATVLANEGLLEFSDLQLYRVREYLPDTGPPEPISGGASALIGSIGAVTAGITDYPSEFWKSFKKSSNKSHDGTVVSPESAGPTSASASNIETSGDRPAAATPNEQASLGRPSSLDRSSDDEQSVSRSSASVPSVNAPSSRSPSMQDSTEASIPAQSRSGIGSRQESRSANLKGDGRNQSFNRTQPVTMDSLMDSAKATGTIVAAGMKSPLDFTMSLAQGFHNAPKLYGDKTVRPHEKVTGFQSGLKAAGKGFGYGMYDGISGLVTQPLQGAKEEGFAGLGKGLIRGGLGLVLKPGAAFWGVPGYAMKGIYAEIVKNFGKSTHNFIIAARTAQGYEDWRASGEGERERIIATWKSAVLQAKGKRKGSKHNVADEDKGKQKTTGVENKKFEKVVGNDDDRRFYGEDGQLLKGFFATRHLSMDDRKQLDKLRKREANATRTPKVIETPQQSRDSASSVQAGIAGTTDEEFEQAIRTAVQRTSNNDPEEDARVEREIRASVRELRRKLKSGPENSRNVGDGEEARNRTVAASTTEYQQPSPRPEVAQPELDTIEMTLHSQDDDEEFTRALAASLEQSRRPRPQSRAQDERLGSDTENDEEFIKAVEASKNAPPPHHRHNENDDQDYMRAIAESKKAHFATSPNPRTSLPSSSRAIHDEGPPPEYRSSDQPQPQLPQSRSTGSELGGNHGEIADSDEEFQRALRASEQEAKERDIEREKQRTEDDIVLEYIKRQSLAEEEYRRNRMQG